MALISLTARGSPAARSGPPWTVPSGRVASFSRASGFAGAAPSPFPVPPHFLRQKSPGHRDLHRIETSAVGLDLGLVYRDVPGDVLGRGVLTEQQVEPLRREPADRVLATRPIQIGGCGRCAVGGSTTILSNCQYLPRWENGSSVVHAWRITASASSKRASASSIGTQKPANSL